MVICGYAGVGKSYLAHNFPNIIDLDLYWHSCIYLGCDNYLRRGVGYHTYKNTEPATKEQRDLLFQKMKEADYEWDTTKKVNYKKNYQNK